MTSAITATGLRKSFAEISTGSGGEDTGCEGASR
jgi:hypothetical protein